MGAGTSQPKPGTAGRGGGGSWKGIFTVFWFPIEADINLNRFLIVFQVVRLPVVEEEVYNTRQI